MKRVCLVCDGYWDQLQGGAEYQMYLLGQALAERGHRVHYVYVDRGTPVKATPLVLEPLSLPAIVRRVFHPYQPLLYRQLVRRLDAIAPDVIINRVGNALTGLCARYSRNRGPRMIWHVANISDLLPWRAPWNRTLPFAVLNRKLLDFGIRNADCVIAQAQYQDELLKRRFGRSADLIVPNFHPEPAGIQIKDDRLIIAWIANLKPKKRPDLFIRLAETLSDYGNSLRLVMAGRCESAAYRRSMERLFEQVPNVEWLGEISIDEVNALLDRASIFVNTSELEGFPNTFVQAWMREVPVVSLQFDPDDVLSRLGLGFHSRSFERMCADVRSLIENAGLRREIGARAAAHARRVHGVQRNVAQIAALVESC